MTPTPEIARAFETFADALTEGINPDHFPDFVLTMKHIQFAARRAVARELAEQRPSEPATPSPDEAGRITDPDEMEIWLRTESVVQEARLKRRLWDAAEILRGRQREVTTLIARTEKAEKERDEAQSDLARLAQASSSDYHLAAKHLEDLKRYSRHAKGYDCPHQNVDWFAGQEGCTCGLTQAIEGEKVETFSRDHFAHDPATVAYELPDMKAALRRSVKVIDPAPTEAAPGVVERAIETSASINFLKKAAKWFRQRPTDGEDTRHWANIFNAENCDKAAALIDSQHSTMEELRKALEESVSLMGATLDADFAFWSAPQNEKVRGPIYAAWRHLNRALEILEKKANRRALSNSESGK